MSTIDTDFSAKEPSLGYFYQIKYALYVLLTNARDLESPKLRIECLDDIDIEDVNSLKLFQTKLHIKGKANLTDASVDFWKTIRIWSSHITNKLIDVDSTIFNLVTTECIPETSLLHKLKIQFQTDLNSDTITDKLNQIALSSQNQTNKEAYKIFLNLPLDIKKKLIKNIRIIDNSISIDEIDSKIKKQLIFSTYPTHLDAFLEILEGWWFKKSIENLTSKIDFIDAGELQLQIANISDYFKADNLPNHFPDQMEVSDDDVESLKEKKFIKQLEIVQINLNSKTVKRAISDFRRAFEQRSKWLRFQLLNPEEEEEYDKRLEDYWRNIFDIMCDEAEGKGQDELMTLGRNFYVEQFAKNCPQIKIREKFNEDYFTRGSYQMLSDTKKIGWHPKYADEL